MRRQMRQPLRPPAARVLTLPFFVAVEPPGHCPSPAALAKASIAPRCRCHRGIRPIAESAARRQESAGRPDSAKQRGRFICHAAEPFAAATGRPCREPACKRNRSVAGSTTAPANPTITSQAPASGASLSEVQTTPMISRTSVPRGGQFSGPIALLLQRAFGALRPVVKFKARKFWRGVMRPLAPARSGDARGRVRSAVVSTCRAADPGLAKARCDRSQQAWLRAVNGFGSWRDL